MYYYFSSDYPAAIKLGGTYLGLIYNTVKPVRIDESLPFVEVCPVGGKQKQISFIPDDNFLASPPNGVTITDMRGGYLIKFFDSFDYFDFSIIKQQKFPEVAVTLFSEGSIKLSIQNKNDFFAETFKTDVSDVEFSTFHTSNACILTVYLKGKINQLNAYDVTDDIKKVFSRSVNSFTFETNLCTTENFLDIAKHKITSVWEFKNGEFVEQERSVCRSDKFLLEKVPNRLLPFVFLEELCVGGKVEEFLCDTMKANADKLGGFLGDFLGVFPPPSFRNIEEVGLIYKDGKNKFYVDYYSFDFEDNKICNIKKTT